MKIDRIQFLKALDIVKGGIATKEFLEQSTSFAFTNSRVITYNDAISLSHPTPGVELEGAIYAPELLGFVSKSKKPELLFKVSENTVKVKCGDAIAELGYHDQILLPLDEIGHARAEEELPDEFLENLNFLKDSCSKDNSRPILTCVHVTDWGMEASDGYQLMRAYVEGFPFPGTLIPADNIQYIKQVNPTHIGRTDGWLHFKNAEGTILSCRTLAAEYPATDGLFEVKGTDVEFPESLPEVVERAMVFSKKDHQLDEEIEVVLTTGELVIQASSEKSKFREKVKFTYKGGDTTFLINPHLLRNITSRNRNSTVGEEKIRFADEGWEYVAVLKQRVA